MTTPTNCPYCPGYMVVIDINDYDEEVTLQCLSCGHYEFTGLNKGDYEHE